MAGKGKAFMGIIVMGLMVLVLVFVADLASVLLIIPLLFGMLFSGLDPTVVLILTIVISVLMLGTVFRIAGFRRGK